MFLNTKNISIFFFVVSLCLLFFTVINFSSCPDGKRIVDSDSGIKEEFSVEVSSITSLPDFKSKIKEEVVTNNISGIDIPILIDDYIRKKFYHDTSYQSSCENWLLVFLDGIFPQYFLTVSLNTDDIMQSSFAACNQQSIIFQDIVKDYGFEYGSVGFSAVKFQHFANAVKVKDRWYFFDPNLEPRYNRSDPDIFDAVVAVDKEVLESMYRHKINENIVSLEYLKPGSIYLKEINKFPARTGVLIQNITAFISWYGWIISLFLSIFFLYFSRKKYY